VPTATNFNTHVRDNFKAIGDAWTAWTPTVTAETGTFTTVAGAGRYMAAGKLITFSVTITITTVGTAANGVRFTLPVNARASGVYLGSGRETASTGMHLQCYANAVSTGQVNKYDGLTPIGAGYTLSLSGAYEAA